MKLTGNLILDNLPEDACDVLLRHSEQMMLYQRCQLIIPGEAISDVYFPISSIISLVTVTEDGTEVETGMVGREGMLGIPVLLGVEDTP